MTSNFATTKRNFLKMCPLIVLGCVDNAFTAEVTDARISISTRPELPPERGLQLDKLLVKDFVVAGHHNLPRVKLLLKEEPALLNSSWDWGRGDWETALGGAAHMGNPEIAKFLIEQGARIDVFACAMLGYSEAVKALCAGNPQSYSLKGPHGIPLIAHAKAGGEHAIEVFNFLKAQESNRSAPDRAK